VNGPQSVVGDVKQGINIAGDDRGLRAGVADQFHTRGQVVQVLGITHIAVNERNIVAFENADVLFGAAADEIVHHRDFVAFAAQMQRHVRADESTTSGNESVQDDVSPLLLPVILN